MTEFTPISALVGGSMIGLAAVLLLKLNGRIAGISGIVNSALDRTSGERLWQGVFIAGLVLGGSFYQLVTEQSLVTREGFSVVQLIIAGLLVGFGTRLGSGCTSGHGVCGIARLSPRSLAATVTFLLTGMITASTVYLLIGGAT